MENQKPVSNQGLLDALESLGAALSVVSISVDMVREELQSVLSVLAAQTAADDTAVAEAAAPPKPQSEESETTSAAPLLFSARAACTSLVEEDSETMCLAETA